MFVPIAGSGGFGSGGGGGTPGFFSQPGFSPAGVDQSSVQLGGTGRGGFGGTAPIGGIGPGGGGSGLGGAIFVCSADSPDIGGSTISGGELLIGDFVGFSNNSASGGAGGLYSGSPIARNGTSDGDGIFLSLGGFDNSMLGSNNSSSSVTFNNTFPLSINDPIGGNGSGSDTAIISSMKIQGPIEFTADNTYYPYTQIGMTGSLALSGDGAISKSLYLEVISPGIFNIANVDNSTSISTLFGGGTVSLGSKNLTIKPRELTVFQGITLPAAQEFSGTISGSGRVTVEAFVPLEGFVGTITQVFSGTNTYTGRTTISRPSGIEVGIEMPSQTVLKIKRPESLPFTQVRIDNRAQLSLDFSGTYDMNSLRDEGVFEPFLSRGSVLLGDGVSNLNLTLNNSVPTTYSSNINEKIGSIGSLTYQGSSTFTFTGTASYSGSTDIASGEFALLSPGVIQSNVNVLSGGLFSGTGTVSGAVTVENGATIKPGGSIGTITVGSLNLSPSSLTEIELSPLIASEIVVTGVANLDGNLLVTHQPGNYPYAFDYDIIFASGGFNGTNFEEEDIIEFPGFDYSVIFSNPNTLTLQIIREPGSVFTGNALITAINLPFVASEELAFLSDDELRAAMNTIAPTRNAFGGFTAQNVMFSMTGLTQDHYAQRRFLGCDISLPCDSCEQECFNVEESTSIWIRALGEYDHLHPGQQTPNYSYVAHGGLIGFDFFNNDTLDLVSIIAGFARTRFWESPALGKGYINQGFASIVGMYQFDPCYVDFALWGGYHHNKNYRTITFTGFDAIAKSGIDGWQFGPHVEFGYDYCDGGFQAEPFLSFDWMNNWQDDFKEKGASPFNMQQKNHYSSMLKSEAGIRLYQCITVESFQSKFTFKERASYLNLTLFDTGEVTGKAELGTDYFTVNTFDCTQNHLSLGFDISMVPLNQNVVYLTLGYNGQYFDSHDSHEGTFEAVFNF